MDELFNIPPYSLDKLDKQQLLLKKLNYLINYHKKLSKEYNKTLNTLTPYKLHYDTLEELPYIPVNLFKYYSLKSCDSKDIIKTLTSSGTTSQLVSKIYLDKETSIYQTKALVKIMQDFIGKHRLPMLIIDSKSTITNRKNFSARGAGILGLSNFGKDHTYILDDNMKLDFHTLNNFLTKYQNKPILIFGFTYMVWEYFYKELLTNNLTLDLQNAILIHSGGWKKLLNETVDNFTFKKLLNNQTNIRKIHNFYGMVEQVGSIFVECEYGHLHTPIFSDIIIRDPFTLKVLPFKQEGLIEVLSILPYSYPGHILLTEDLGTILGEDDCKCGRKGKYFSVKGRLPKAEIRGCSDTHAFDQEKN
jgi:phenylacetate-coenzyme A ligase PaaK-like adenylate-forming protein